MRYVIPLEKASVKPYTRVKRGKFEHVKGYDISRMTQKLDRPTGTFSGRERYVMISELAKRGYRYLGDGHEQADPFLMERYGIKSVKKIAIPFRDGHIHYAWIGKPTNKTGKEAIAQLAREKLPSIPNETLPPEVSQKYVQGQMERYPEVSYKGENFKVVKKNGEWMLRTVGWDKPLDPNDHLERLHRESAKTHQRYTPLGINAGNFSKEYVIDKLLKMGYTTKPLEKSFLQDARALIAEQTFVDQPTKAKWLNIVLDVMKTEDENDGENKTDDSKDSKEFHKDLFDVEDELMDFIQNESGNEKGESGGLITEKEAKDRAKKEIKKKEEVKKSGGICPFDGSRGIYLRRYYQAPYWIREYKCYKGHVFQETQ